MLLLTTAARPCGAAADRLRVPDYAHGNFKGSAHCYGMLTITSRLITWMTPFSFCRSSPYIVHDLQESRSGTRITFLLTHPSAKCFYPVLVLTHDRSAGIGWNVAPHRSLENAGLDRDDVWASCYLYRY